MVQKSYLAVNVCYPSIKGKNDPKGSSEVSRAIPATQVQREQALGEWEE